MNNAQFTRWVYAEVRHSQWRAPDPFAVACPAGITAILRSIDASLAMGDRVSEISIDMPILWPKFYGEGPYPIQGRAVEDSKITIEIWRGEINAIRASGVLSIGRHRVPVQSETIPRSELTFL